MKDLERAIQRYIKEWNHQKRKLVWTKRAGQILQSMKKASRY